MLPTGSHLNLLLFILGGGTTFCISNSLWRIGLFFAQNVLSPVAGATEMLPYGVPIDSINIYIFPYKHFFDVKFLMENRPFFRSRFFILTDGMGWMGWTGQSTFCFLLIP